jgi:VanZ family protein
VAVYAGIIFYLSAQTHPLPQLTAVIWDKALHATEYAGLALLILRAFRGQGLTWPTASALAILVASAYGGTDEWHQSFVPGRGADVLDWVADTIGAGLGSGGYYGAAIGAVLKRA